MTEIYKARELSWCPKCCAEKFFTTNESFDSLGRKILKGICAQCSFKKLLPQNNSIDGFTIPFGKHEGKKLKDVPRSYLEWLVNESSVDSKLKKKVQSFLEKALDPSL